MAKRRLTPLTVFAPESAEVGGGLVAPGRGEDWYVSTYEGNNQQDGKSWSSPLSTMAEALKRAKTSDRIFVAGKITEEISIATAGLSDLNLKFDIQIIGVKARHHADQPDSTAFSGRGYDYGSAVWQPPASPTAATALLNVYGRGWKIANFLFDCPVDAAAIVLNRNASSGTSEYDASHAEVVGCRFTSGKVGIENAGGASFVEVRGNRFQLLTESGGAGIKCTSTSVAVPLSWVIEDNLFFNNASHILSSMSYSTIRRNVFGRFTATLSVDIDDQPSSNQGEYNVITQNYLSGTYGATAYPPGTNNEWAGNNNVLAGGLTAADPA